MDKDAVEILEKQTAYEGFFRIDRYRLRHRLHAGGWSKPIVRENFERGRSVVVLPYDPVSDSIVLTEQFRIGAMAASLGPWVVEIVAGMVEDGEDVETVARRETREEIGCDVGDLIPICKYLSTPGGSSETVELFCGRVDAANVAGVCGNPDEDEDILVASISFGDAMKSLEEGRIDNAATLIALQWLALNRNQVRARWR